MEVVGRILDGSRMQTQKGFSALHLAVQNGLDRLVQQLLALPNSAPDARDVDGATPLHWAAAHGMPCLLPHPIPWLDDQETDCNFDILML